MYLAHLLLRLPRVGLAVEPRAAVEVAVRGPAPGLRLADQHVVAGRAGADVGLGPLVTGAGAEVDVAEREPRVRDALLRDLVPA